MDEDNNNIRNKNQIGYPNILNIDVELLKSIHIKEEVPIDFFNGRCTTIAKDLLGNLLINITSEGITGGIIVETEAYLGRNDPACHYSKGKTKRNKPFLLGMGTIYVFQLHRYYNLNFITQYKSNPECVLIRAIEPIINIDLMIKRRRINDSLQLTNGPGKLSEALGITLRNLNEMKINSKSLFLYNINQQKHEIECTTRIGISKAMDWPLRFYIKNNRYISKLKYKTPPISSCFSETSFYKEYSRMSLLNYI